MSRAAKRHQKNVARKANLKRRSAPARANRPAPRAAPADYLTELTNQGLQHHLAGRLEQAEAIYRQVLQAKPGHADANHLLGGLAQQRGDHAAAAALIGKAVAKSPKQPAYRNTLGNTLQALGRPDEAVASYRMAIALKPDYADAHFNLAGALKAYGEVAEAVASYEACVALNPRFVEAHNNLGNAYRNLGRLDDAVASYTRALGVDPNYPEAHSNLGAVCQLLGRREEALAHCRRAIALKPEIDAFWSAFIACLDGAEFAAVDEAFFDDLLRLVERPSVKTNAIAGPIMSALRHHPDFAAILASVGPDATHETLDFADLSERLGAIPLFLRIIEQSHINDLEIERLLTLLRRAMLIGVEADEARVVSAGTLAFASALALHCFTNEYVFFESAEEGAAVDQLAERLGVLAEMTGTVAPIGVAVLAAYRPLHNFLWTGALFDRDWPEPLRAVMTRQIVEPMEEQALQGQIAQLTPIDDAVSQAVRAQYEANPYPRWVKADIEPQPRSIEAVMRGSPFHFDLGDYQSVERPEILVAGCGTGQHALIPATKFANAHVLAIDLSLASLSYGARKTRELGIDNIEFGQADISQLGALDRSFDLIECSGVLHHMGDPMEGWRVLVDLLKPGGFMKIGLYSETARAPVVAARAMIAERGYRSTPADIRRCREDIIATAGSTESVLARLVEFRDFYSLSECRDLLFHVREHRFTLPQIEAALDELKLDFLGFEMRDQGVMRAFSEAHPEADDRRSLAAWHRFETEHPGTFRGMYQFWCRKA